MRLSGRVQMVEGLATSARLLASLLRDLSTDLADAGGPDWPEWVVELYRQSRLLAEWAFEVESLNPVVTEWFQPPEAGQVTDLASPRLRGAPCPGPATGQLAQRAGRQLHDDITYYLGQCSDVCDGPAIAVLGLGRQLADTAANFLGGLVMPTWPPE